jgi:esterase/lipase superfamily enzyme
MDLLVFGPAGAKVLVFPTREGRFYDYENWGLVDALRRSVQDGRMRLFCVDGVDSESLYCRSIPPPARAERHRQYERYILQEVIPLMLSENGIPSLIVHGCSIGGLPRDKPRASIPGALLQGGGTQRAIRPYPRRGPV